MERNRVGRWLRWEFVPRQEVVLVSRDEMVVWSRDEVERSESWSLAEVGVWP